MLSLKAVSQFKSDFKKFKHNKTVLDVFEAIVDTLRKQESLHLKFLDHPLIGIYRGMRECHIQPDVLLIYWVSEKTKTLYLERIGSHSELFR